jgi:hypothetical protein
VLVSLKVPDCRRIAGKQDDTVALGTRLRLRWQVEVTFEEVRAHLGVEMSRPRRDSIEIPTHIWHRMQNALAYAA